jgi:phosphate acetyltransferase
MNLILSNDLIKNFTYEEITIGQTARLLCTLSLADIQAFTAVCGDTNPAHTDAEFASDTLIHGVVAHGMWGGALISALLGTKFPGHGTIYRDQVLHFCRPVRVGNTVKVRLPRVRTPRIQLFDPEARFQDLLAMRHGMAAVRCAVVHPCDAESLSGAMDSAKYGLIVPVLKRPELRTGPRMSHVFRFDVPLYSKPSLITDAALNIRPSLAEKVDIIQNAVDFARIMGVQIPKVAILSAVETVNPGIPSTLGAAALCKMADRSQIRGAVLDGPLAFDNAISAHAAQIKKIDSPVAADADILAVPDLESGNMLAKQPEYLAGASGCGLVLGARVPIALTSRADGPLNRVACALLAKVAAHHARRNNDRLVKYIY